MLKGIGIGMIVCGSTGLGMVLAGDLERRIRELQTLLRLMLLLKGEIRYLKKPLPDAFLQIHLRAEEPFRSFFFKTAQDLRKRTGQNAADIWRINQKELLSGLHWTEKERLEFLEFGGMLGCLDVEMQLNALDYYVEQLRTSIAQALETSRSKRRLYQYLGVLGGLALVLLIL